jgi:hypothetical protein
MTLVGCDLHSRKQPVAVLDTTTGEVLEQELAHDGDAVERFYRALRPPVTIGIETTGYTQLDPSICRPVFDGDVPTLGVALFPQCLPEGLEPGSGLGICQ